MIYYPVAITTECGKEGAGLTQHFHVVLVLGRLDQLPIEQAASVWMRLICLDELIAGDIAIRGLTVESVGVIGHAQISQLLDKILPSGRVQLFVVVPLPAMPCMQILLNRT